MGFRMRGLIFWGGEGGGAYYQNFMVDLPMEKLP